MSAPRHGRVLLVVLLAVLLVAAGAAIWFWLGVPRRPDVDAGRAVADAFVARVRAGEADAAWESTTAEFKSFEGKENFRRRAAKTPSLKLPLKFVSTQPVTVGDRPRDEYLYQADAGGKMATVRILLGEENGDWKVDRLTTD